jgi:hypothetical protein
MKKRNSSNNSSSSSSSGSSSSSSSGKAKNNKQTSGSSNSSATNIVNNDKSNKSTSSTSSSNSNDKNSKTKSSSSSTISTQSKQINTTATIGGITQSGRITFKPHRFASSDYDKNKYLAHLTYTDSIDNIYNNSELNNEYVLVTYTDEPATYNEAITCVEAKQWLKAIEEELNAHLKNNTWSVVDINNNHINNIISAKWIFKKKKDANGNVCRYKARLVARGFTQVYGIDYDATFAPVLKYKSLRIILLLSVIYNNNIEQLDVKTAFLNATVKENIYVQPPEGVVTTDKQILKLNKALYGIKQAPREWNENINKYLLSIQFKRCIKESCIYIKTSKNNNNIIIGLFVDDILVSFNEEDNEEWFEYKKNMKQQYELSEMGEAQHILGMRITRRNNKKQLYIDQ